MRTLRYVLLAVLLALGACARVVRETPAPPSSRFVAEAGLDAERIAALRAGPPMQTEFAAGKQFDADEDRLGARGYVRVGTGYYREAHEAVPQAAHDQARELGADQALVYAPDTASDDVRVAFFVRMALPFGATFRDLDDAERRHVGGSGVQLGNIVGGSPASRANLLAGDIVLKVDDGLVSGKADFQQRLRARAGQRVTLTVWRGGRTLVRSLRLGVPPAR